MYTAEIITVGDEILIGQIVDTNSAWMAVQLNLSGVKVTKMTSVSDSAEAIKTALSEAEKNADIILVTGGLGPTVDDITKKVLADYFGSDRMIVHEPSLKFIETRFAKRGIAMNELNKRQAEVPDCCTVIPNRHGTAPGMWFEKGGTVVVSMPGVPSEMMKMFPEVLALLKQKAALPKIFHKTLMTYGITESELAKKIESWEKALPQETAPAYLPNIETGVKLRLTSYASNGNLLIEKQFDKLTAILGKYAYGYEPDTLESVTGKLLLEKGATVATAESCTGGRIAHRITSVAGSSAYFKGGIVAYSNKIKEKILEVNPADIDRFGVVSREVATQMAEGVRRAFNVDYAVSTTGIAGPTGGTAVQPVGLCWFGIATPNGTKTFSHNFSGDRQENIAAASSVALNALRLLILSSLPVPSIRPDCFE
ncbi:MAG: competence/damage-inducible protein A [Prevotellaceae bacterium]|jgi:nicotinamide-nucleotide amidase|nr:competence/damage-inducible protein A [Prevotellaceae bacterium]